MINSIKDALLNYIGDYEPILTNENQYIDVPWVFSAVLLIVIIYCIFKALGGLIKDVR